MNKTGTAAGGHFYVKEPGSALTHFIGLLLAIAFLAPILVHGAMGRVHGKYDSAVRSQQCISLI